MGNGIDKKTAKKLEMRQKRKHASTKYKEEYSLNLETETTDREESESETNDFRDNKFELLDSDSASDKDSECSLVQNRNKYKELCKAVDRCKVCNRDACNILNAVLGGCYSGKCFRAPKDCQGRTLRHCIFSWR